MDKTKYNSFAKQRGEKIKRLRKQTKLSREMFAEKHGIAAATLKYWENGISPSINSDGLQRLVKALNTENIPCTIEDLLVDAKDGSSAPLVNTPNTQISFAQVINLAKQSLQQAVYYEVQHTNMQPMLNKGDKLLAQQKPLSQLTEYMGQLVLVEVTENNQADMLVGILATTNIKNIVSINSFSSSIKPQLIAMDTITTLAPVVFIYKP